MGSKYSRLTASDQPRNHRHRSERYLFCRAAHRGIDVVVFLFTARRILGVLLIRQQLVRAHDARTRNKSVNTPAA